MDLPSLSALRPNHQKNKKTGHEKKPEPFSALKFRMIVFTTLGILAAVLILIIIGQHSTPDFTMLIAALMAMCGFLLYDILGRRGWEQTVTDQIRKMNQGQDRLIREVAKNRNDITDIRDALSDVAHTVETNSQKSEDASAIETRMVENIARQLGAIGENRKKLERQAYDEEILELTNERVITARAPKPGSAGAPTTAEVGSYSDTVVLELIRHAVEHDQIDLFVQPIVSLPQRKPRFLELFGRIRARPGVYLPAENYMRLAEQHDLVSTIDNLILLRCLQILRNAETENMAANFFLNIGGGTLSDSGFMGDLLSFVSRNRRIAAKLVFEMKQSDLENINAKSVPIIEGLSKLGCRFSMDHIRKHKIDTGMLRRLKISFLKIDAGWLMEEASTRGGIERMHKLKRTMDKAGIDVIVEKIETERDLRELLDYSIDYGQGYYFGKPDYFGAYVNKQKAKTKV